MYEGSATYTCPTTALMFLCMNMVMSSVTANSHPNNRCLAINSIFPTRGDYYT